MNASDVGDEVVGLLDIAIGEEAAATNQDGEDAACDNAEEFGFFMDAEFEDVVSKNEDEDANNDGVSPGWQNVEFEDSENQERRGK